MVTKDFLRDVFAGKKRFIRLENVKFVQVPKYDEISVKALYDKLLALPDMASFFPNKYAKGRQCDRAYLFNVANTFHPSVMKDLIDYAHKHRHDISSEKQL